MSLANLSNKEYSSFANPDSHKSAYARTEPSLARDKGLKGYAKSNGKVRIKIVSKGWGGERVVRVPAVRVDKVHAKHGSAKCANRVARHEHTLALAEAKKALSETAS